EDEGWRVRKDGARFWAEVMITALRDSEGAVIGFAKVTRDLTARKEAQDALHRSEQTFQLLVESIQDCAIFMLDLDGRVASWNAVAERIKGYRAHEIMGEHFSMFYPPDDVAQGKPQWALEIAEREGRHEDEGWRVRKDGTRFWANTVISPMRDSQGDRKSTRLNSSHVSISYAVFCLKKKKKIRKKILLPSETRYDTC